MQTNRQTFGILKDDFDGSSDKRSSVDEMTKNPCLALALIIQMWIETKKSKVRRGQDEMRDIASTLDPVIQVMRSRFNDVSQ